MLENLTSVRFERYPQLITILDRVIERHRPVPVLVVHGGDLFESSNALSARSQGDIDFAFLFALRFRAPVLLNLGNHELDVVDDLHTLMRTLERMNIDVIGNIRGVASSPT